MFFGLKSYNLNYMFKKLKVVTQAPSSDHVDYPIGSPWVFGASSWLSTIHYLSSKYGTFQHHLLPVVRPHGEHGEPEAEAEEGQEHRVQVVQVERRRRVVLQKEGEDGRSEIQ